MLLLLAGIAWASTAVALESALALREIYAQTVDRKLILPEPEQLHYAAMLNNALQNAGLSNLPAQYLLLVDRSPEVQAILLFWRAADGQAELIGTSPASTSMRGGFEYFETPLGVFDHSNANLDFRAEGSRNAKGIRGYGIKGMRVYDFGWVLANKTWAQGKGEMRLQIHTTDPDYLELRLGSAQSKGCIRIPATLNQLIDGYGILDEGYERALAQGRKPWLLRPDRQPTPWSGRYLVIVDSGRIVRPDWSPLPAQPTLKKKAGKQQPVNNPPQPPAPPHHPS
jgi:hypothetical protein